jgi:hypothetical protein
VPERFAGPPVRPEFRPTLPDLLGPRMRRLGRVGTVVVAVLALVLVVALIALGRSGGDGTKVLVVRGPVTFNLKYDPVRLERATPQAGDSLLLRTVASDPDPERFSVRPITLPPYTGDPAGIEPIVASGLIRQMRRDDPSFILRSEGRTRINQQPGYQIQFQTRVGGRLAFGRRTMLFADEPGVRQGGDITLVSVRSPTIPNVDAVGSNGPLKQPYRSFRLGAERP